MRKESVAAAAGPISKVVGGGSTVPGKGLKPLPPATPQPKNVGDYMSKYTRPAQMTAAGAAGVKKADLDITGKYQDLVHRMSGRQASRPESYGKTILGGAAGGGIGLVAGLLLSLLRRGKYPMQLAAKQGPAIAWGVTGVGSVLGAGEGAYQAAKNAMALDKLMSTPVSAEEILKFAAAKLPPPPFTPAKATEPPATLPMGQSLNAAYSDMQKRMPKPVKGNV